MKGNNEYRNIIFDLDGTLVDSEGDIGASLSEAFRSSIGEDCGRVERKLLGMPLREIVAAVRPGLDEKARIVVCARFREIYDVSVYPLTALMPGVAEILQRLSLTDKVLFIATNKPVNPTLRLLEKFRIAGAFKDVAAPDALPGVKMSKSSMVAFLLEKWKLDRAHTLMVGDSEQDITAAGENRIDSAYLLSGYGSAVPVTPSPSMVLADISRLAEYL